VNRSDLKELHYITPIANVPSILQRGILSKNRAKPLNPASIAMQEIQHTRDRKAVPGGLALHEYANLYVCARNPMMYKRQSQHLEICVLRISTDVLDLPNVVVADGNAASQYTAFWPSPSGLSKINADWVFAEYWTDPDQITRWRKAAAKCAEVLVPHRISSDMIIGAYVSSPQSAGILIDAGFTGPITVDPHLFFRG
jgi:ssDNA thymidine ADP-ribosyltransferase, DarT